MKVSKIINEVAQTLHNAMDNGKEFLYIGGKPITDFTSSTTVNRGIYELTPLWDTLTTNETEVTKAGSKHLGKTVISSRVDVEIDGNVYGGLRLSNNCLVGLDQLIEGNYYDDGPLYVQMQHRKGSDGITYVEGRIVLYLSKNGNPTLLASMINDRGEDEDERIEPLSKWIKANKKEVLEVDVKSSLIAEYGELETV